MNPRLPSPVGLPAFARCGALVAAIGLVLAACGTSSGSTNPGALTGSSSPSAGIVSSPPSATPGAIQRSPAPSGNPHGVPALEALLPAKVGTVALERLSLKGADFYATGTDATRAQLDAMLSQLGKTVADLSVADAGDPSGLTVIEIGAFRVAGSRPDQLLSEWVASTQASKPHQIVVSDVTVAGRRLTKLVDQVHPVGGVTYAYAKGDTLFAVRADDPALLSSALAQLPTP